MGVAPIKSVVFAALAMRSHMVNIAPGLRCVAHPNSNRIRSSTSRTHSNIYVNAVIDKDTRVFDVLGSNSYM